MAEAAISSLVQLLGEQVIQKVKFVQGVEEQVQLLKDELRRMQSFLIDANKKQAEDDRVRHWISEIKELAQDADDMIEMFLINVANERNRGFLKSCTTFSKRMYHLDQIGEHIEKIQKRLEEINRSRETYGIKDLGEASESSRRANVESRRRLASWKKDEHLVGMEDHVKKLLRESILNEEKKGLSVAVVDGIGGIGKSTLAREIYNHPDVVARFDCRGWVVVSSEFAPQETLKQLILELPGSDQQKILQLQESTTDKLYVQEKLREMLGELIEGKSYFIVLDDVWEENHWEFLRDAFPNQQENSSPRKMKKKTTQPNPKQASDYTMTTRRIATPKPLTPQVPYSDFPPLSYVNAVNTTPSPLKTQNSFQPLQSSKGSSSETSYFTKPDFEYIIQSPFTQEPDIPTLKRFTSKLFDEKFHWLADDICKTREFYELILVDTQSAEITHIPDNSNSRIGYSKLVIKRILKPSDFSNIRTEASFSINYIPPRFNYFDYIKAWSRTLFLRSFDHSWFISFHKDFQFPTPDWFLDWWEYFGPTQEIFPPQVSQSFLIFQRHTKSPYPLITFHADFRVPWILAWSFQLKPIKKNRPHSLIRDFRIKWWSKFDTKFCNPELVTQIIKDKTDVTTTLKKIPDPVIGTPPKKEVPVTTPTSLAAQPTQQEDSDDDESELFKMFLQYQKMKKKGKATTSRAKPASSSSSTEDPFGGPQAQDLFEL